MTPVSLIALLAAATGIALGVFVYARNTKRILNKLFMLMCLSSAYCALVEFGYRQSASFDAASWWRRVDVIWPFALSLTLHFVLTFTDKVDVLRRRITYAALYVPAICISLLELTTHVVTGPPVKEHWGWTFSVPADPWPAGITLVWASAVGLLGLGLVLRHWMTVSDRRKKKQARFVLIGLSLPIFAVLLTEGFLPLGSVRVPGTASIALVLSHSLVAYAICRHGLFELTPGKVVENIVATMSDALLLIAVDRKILSVNRAACELLGYEETEVVGLPVGNIFVADVDGGARHPVTKAEWLAKSVSVGDLEATLRTKPGRLVPASLSVSALREGEDGPFLGLVCIARDMTERKRAEAALRESEERYRSFVQSFHGIAFRSRLDFMPIFFHGAVEAITGYSQDDFLAGKPTWDQIIHKDDLHLIREFMGEMASRPDCARETEYRIVRRDGRTRWIHEYVRNLCDDSGRPVFVQGAVYDITKRKLAEEALRESHEFHRTLVDALPDALVMVDLEGRVTFASPQALDLFGYDTGEGFLGKSCLDCVTPEDRERAEAFFRTAWGKGMARNVQYTLLKRDGSRFPGEISSAPIRDPQGEPEAFLAVIKDVTERERAQRGLRTYQENLRRLASELSHTEERERRQIATGLHDRVGTALAFAKLRLGMLQKSVSSKDINEQAEEIRGLVEKAIRDIRSLTFEISSPTLHELGFEAAAKELAEELQESHNLIVRLENDGEPKPLGEPFRVVLFRSVRELLVNVVKHARASEVSVSIRRDQGDIRISVEDDGIGFDTSEIESRTGRRGGLGLFGIRERLGFLGGHLEIESKKGCGTKATLSAPLARDSGLQEGE